jgi:predicted DNA-binding transcriptional regulator AlpA
MTPANAQLNYRYLDSTELAHILGLSMRTIILRAKHRPWLLPPRANLYDRDLLRWRQDIVEAWLASLKF